MTRGPTRRLGYVYILHFAEPIHHARHYCGCSCSLLQRMETHAKGFGANLTRVALARSIPWKLSAVGVCDSKDIYSIERQIKRWHGLEEHCSCCTPDPRAIPNTTPYPLERIQWPLWSNDLLAWHYNLQLFSNEETK